MLPKSKLRDKIEFHFSDRNGIAFFTSHFRQFFDDAAEPQYFLKIQHRIGIIQNDVTAQHIHQPADHDEGAVLVPINIEIQIIVCRILEFFFRSNGFHRGQVFENLENSLDELPRSLARNRGDGKDLIFAPELFLKRFEILLRAENIAFIADDD